MPTIEIPKEELPKLKTLTELSEGNFDSFVSSLRLVKPALTIARFSNELANISHVFGREELITILRTIFALYWLKERTGLRPDALADEIVTASKRADPEQFPEERESSLRNRLSVLLALDNSLGVTAKAMDAMTEHERIFRDARILSDLRPIFTGEGTTTPAAVIIHNLQISFHINGQHQEIYVALDTNDLGKLREVVDRAERKTNALEGVISKSNMTYLKA